MLLMSSDVSDKLVSIPSDMLKCRSSFTAFGTLGVDTRAARFGICSAADLLELDACLLAFSPAGFFFFGAAFFLVVLLLAVFLDGPSVSSRLVANRLGMGPEVGTIDSNVGVSFGDIISFNLRLPRLSEDTALASAFITACGGETASCVSVVASMR